MKTVLVLLKVAMFLGSLAFGIVFFFMGDVAVGFGTPTDTERWGGTAMILMGLALAGMAPFLLKKRNFKVFLTLLGLALGLLAVFTLAWGQGEADEFTEVYLIGLLALYGASRWVESRVGRPAGR